VRVTDPHGRGIGERHPSAPPREQFRFSHPIRSLDSDPAKLWCIHAAAGVLGCPAPGEVSNMGILLGRTEDRSSPLVGVPARLYTGYFFLVYGLQKAAGGFDGEVLRRTLLEWVGSTRYAFYVPFLERVAIPHAGVFALLVIFGEILVGAALLAGCATRLAAAGGMFLCLNFLFGSGAALLSAEKPVVFLLLLVTVHATAAGRVLGLDWLLKAVLPRWAA
jgi:thiosulfate dehydrogenase [quinone] large subunit